MKERSRTADPYSICVPEVFCTDERIEYVDGTVGSVLSARVVSTCGSRCLTYPVCSTTTSDGYSGIRNFDRADLKATLASELDSPEGRTSSSDEVKGEHDLGDSATDDE
ncbi:hypothetical protein M0R88_11940 [Halorussus gelatinilyticus]|uniref:Uncharacterized protein n=1 Tax=Halorussus gelatinilyticus TaxID=2937524 RepID=A0A8U0IDV4_9EURY|nr:hypothetical protein [Halorussus gelatinilyticus]UPV99236.1 hypothetical protein M0R88_11940 [Halorussus gelatinilyticus]